MSRGQVHYFSAKLTISTSHLGGGGGQTNHVMTHGHRWSCDVHEGVAGLEEAGNSRQRALPWGFNPVPWFRVKSINPPNELLILHLERFYLETNLIWLRLVCFVLVEQFIQTAFLEDLPPAEKKFINRLGFVTIDRLIEGEKFSCLSLFGYCKVTSDSTQVSK